MRLTATAFRYACWPFSLRPVPASERLSVLAYHSLSGTRASDFDLPPEQFDEQLEYLRLNTDVLSPRTLQSKNALDSALSGPAAILTFDDAYADFFDTVYPRLCKWGLVAMLFIPAGAIEKKGPSHESFPAPLCSWAQLREMIQSGHIIPASHSYSHRSFHHLSATEQHSELTESKNLIEDRLGHAVRDFAWPFGHWNQRSLGRARYLYSRIWGFQGGVIHQGRTLPAVLPRIPIRRRDRHHWFVRKLTGAAALEDRLRSQVANLRAKVGQVHG